MRALYIGILTPGTTSRMRADTLRRLLPHADWQLVDTDEGFRQAARLLRTLAFRARTGPLVRQVNRRVGECVKTGAFDLVWVDKGVYLWPATVAALRRSAGCLVHFTPDTAFHANRSRHFFKSIAQYDLLVTTKSFELADYHRVAEPSRVLLTTQAYDPCLHRRPEQPTPKRHCAVFIGLCEPDRERCVEALLAAGVPVRLGGQGWERFVRRNAARAGLHYLGGPVFGERYVQEYAAGSVGLGLLSRRFPEMHTTRSFEIPACGTLLATERTADTSVFFNEDEALFFDNYLQLAQRLHVLLQRPERLAEMADKGHQRVTADGRDYASVLSGVLRRCSRPLEYCPPDSVTVVLDS